MQAIPRGTTNGRSYMVILRVTYTDQDQDLKEAAEVVLYQNNGDDYKAFEEAAQFLSALHLCYTQADFLARPEVPNWVGAMITEMKLNGHTPHLNIIRQV